MYQCTCQLLIYFYYIFCDRQAIIDERMCSATHLSCILVN
ncbi:hypothetical protein Q9966_001326, partial [Columba livia]